MRKIALFIVLCGFLAVSVVAQEPQFPRGTVTFFNSRVYAAVAAPDGGVWAAAQAGLVRYTEAGAGTTHAVSGTPYRLAAAADGSIWFVTTTQIARMSPGGTIVEQYALTNVRAIAVASDGALWYARSAAQSVIGRIAGGTMTEVVSPTETWSLAAATGGDVWIIGNGLGTSMDNLHRMTAAGTVTTIALGHDVLFGELQSLPDGTLYVGTGIRQGVLRLDPGAQTFHHIALPGTYYFLADREGDLWTGGIEQLGFVDPNGIRRVRVEMPGDPRDCGNIPAYGYVPLAVDAEGGLWIEIHDDAIYIPLPPPCPYPVPPPMPDLIRVDTHQFLRDHVPEHIPALSPILLAVLSAVLALAAMAHLRS